MTLTGRVEDHGLADILRNLVKSRDTARVAMSREGITKSVHVQQGRIIFAQSDDKDDRLGECLLRDGMISVEQYDQSGKLIRPGKRQGTILVELGYITPAELVRGVKLQVEHVVTDLLAWRRGTYSIEMRELDVKDAITLNISTENLLFHGIKRGAGWSQVVRGLGGTLDSVLERSADFDTRLYKLDLSEDEGHIVSLVNGRISAAQICSMSYLSNHDTCVTLFGLTCCGVIEPGNPKDPEQQFRDQVAESELQDVREAVTAFNASLARAEAPLRAVFGERARAEALAAIALVLDEHWDALHSAGREDGTFDVAVIVENVTEVQPGMRRDVVERALAAARASIAAAAGRAGGPEAEAHAAAALVPHHEPRRSR